MHIFSLPLLKNTEYLTLAIFEYSKNDYCRKKAIYFKFETNSEVFPNYLSFIDSEIITQMNSHNFFVTPNNVWYKVEQMSNYFDKHNVADFLPSVIWLQGRMA